MAFPSSGGSKAASLANSWETARATATNIKRRAAAMLAMATAAPVAGSTILAFLHFVIEMQDKLAAIPKTAELAAYAQAQSSDPSLNIVAEFNAMAAATEALRAWIIANFPKDGAGYLLREQFDANGKIVERTFSVAALATFRIQLQALIATID